MSTRWKNVALVPADRPLAQQIAKPELRRDSMVPTGYHVKRFPAKVARGAYKPRMANRGDAPTTSHAANRDGRIMGNSYHTSIRNLAAKGW